MKLPTQISIAAAVVCLLPIIFWGYHFHQEKLSGSPQDWGSFGDYIGGILSTLLSFAAFVGLLWTLEYQKRSALDARRKDDDQRFYENAITSLERAWGLISENGTLGEPVRDRLTWMATARLLLAAAETSSRISIDSEGLRSLYIAQSDYWRHRFYELINPFSITGVGSRSSYFDGTNVTPRMPIDERSIRVLFDFTKWPDGHTDHIDSINRYSQDELDKLGVGMAGVKQYIQTTRR